MYDRRPEPVGPGVVFCFAEDLRRVQKRHHELIPWPMVFLPEVWFSLEGTAGWVKQRFQWFPLTRMIKAIRRITNDGAALTDLGTELMVLAFLTLFGTALGARLFLWHR